MLAGKIMNWRTSGRQQVRFLNVERGRAYLVLLDVEHQVDERHQILFVGAEVGSVEARGHSVKDNQVLRTCFNTHFLQRNTLNISPRTVLYVD